MNVYIYAADLYCEDCGKAIRLRLEQKGFKWDDERGFDSNDYPAGPYPDGGGEADSPQHCGSGADCLNAIEVSDGYKVGDWLENKLTSDGVEYVRKAVREGGEVSELWADYYRDNL